MLHLLAVVLASISVSLALVFDVIEYLPIAVTDCEFWFPSSLIVASTLPFVASMAVES